jgi:hypothetical protein
MMLQHLLPDTLGGWQGDKTTPLPAPGDLYGYMDGGAELYLSYGFREAISRTYIREGLPEVQAEIYDLAEPRNAFGVYTQTRESENNPLGQGGYEMPGAVFFWKDRYFIALSAWESEPESREFMLTLGGYIEKLIPGKGNLPQVLQWLPEEGLAPFGYIYFHHPVWLNAYYFIAHDNILLIGEDTDALLGKYGNPENRQYLVLVHYPEQEKAERAFASFGTSFFPEGLVDHCIRLEDNTWMAARCSGQLITAVFNAPSAEEAKWLLRAVAEKYETEQ